MNTPSQSTIDRAYQLLDEANARIASGKSSPVAGQHIEKGRWVQNNSLMRAIAQRNALISWLAQHGLPEGR